MISYIQTKKGYLLDVKGLIKTDNLIDDLFSNFENLDYKKKINYHQK